MKQPPQMPAGYPVAPQVGSHRELPVLPQFAPNRPAQRRAVRPEPRSGEVRGRDGEILSRNNRTNEVADQFDVPAHFREKDWDLQWVRTHCHGKPDPQNVQNHLENGWRAVPSTRWPGFFHPKDYTGAIAREGQMLMERPMSMSHEAIRDGIEAARRQRRNQSASFKGVDKVLTETGGAQAGFETADEEHASRVQDRPFLKRTVEPMPASLYPERTLDVGSEI